jgi:hypothetical protein
MIEEAIMARFDAALTHSPPLLRCAAIFPLQAPQDQVPPYLVYSLVGQDHEWSLRGAAGLANSRVLIEVWSPIYRETKAILAEVRSIMAAEGADFTCGGVSVLDDYLDTDLRRYAASAVFSLWHGV